MFRFSLVLVAALAFSACGGSDCENTPGAGKCTSAGGGGGSGGGAGGGGGSVSCGADTWTNYAKTWFEGNCAGCHSTEFGTYAAVKGSHVPISSRISSGNMPPGGGLSDGEKQRISDWFSCDMPQ